MHRPAITLGRRVALATLGAAAAIAPSIRRARAAEFTFKVGISLAQTHPTVVRM